MVSTFLLHRKDYQFDLVKGSTENGFRMVKGNELMLYNYVWIASVRAKCEILLQCGL